MCVMYVNRWMKNKKKIKWQANSKDYLFVYFLLETHVCYILCHIMAEFIMAHYTCVILNTAVYNIRYTMVNIINWCFELTLKLSIILTKLWVKTKCERKLKSEIMNRNNSEKQLHGSI